MSLSLLDCCAVHVCDVLCVHTRHEVTHTLEHRLFPFYWSHLVAVQDSYYEEFLPLQPSLPLPSPPPPPPPSVLSLSLTSLQMKAVRHQNLPALLVNHSCLVVGCYTLDDRLAHNLDGQLQIHIESKSDSKDLRLHLTNFCMDLMVDLQNEQL